MKKTISAVIVFLVFPIAIIAQTETASQYENTAGAPGTQNSAFGFKAGSSNEGKENVFLGYIAGANSAIGSYNIFGGSRAGLNSKEGNYNNIMGYNSGANNIGSYNVFLGANTGTLNTKGERNVFLGYAAGNRNVDASYNVFMGFYSGRANTGMYNVFSGYYSGEDNTGNHNVFSGYFTGERNTGTGNSFLGSYAGRFNTGNYNTYTGYQSGYTNTSGANNTFSGMYSGRSNTTGTNGTFLGAYAGYKTTTGNNNVFVGRNGGINNVAGANNVYVGTSSGYNAQGTGNVFLGYNTGFNEEGSNLLYVDNSSTKEPLIWGRFDKDIVNVNGRLGVQTTNPASLLSVGGSGESGSLSVTGQATGHIVNFRDNQGENVFQINGRITADNIKVKIGDFDEIAGSHHLIVSDKQSYFLNGNVGIGTVSPDEKLAVNGKIHAKEVRVDLTGWPDYVFAKGYNLPTLAEVEQHIKDQGHLQNIPSAISVEKNGIELGQMNAKLLEKIEQLTLYTIQQQKELEHQKDKNLSLEKRLEKLESLLKNN